MGTLSIVCVLSLIIATISTLPISIEKVPRIEIPLIIEDKLVTESATGPLSETLQVIQSDTKNVTLEVLGSDATITSNITTRNSVRPGMRVLNYDIGIEPDVGGRIFRGNMLAAVTITDADTREDPIVFHAEELNVISVQFALGGSTTFSPADFVVDDGVLEISAGVATSYTLRIEYEGNMGNAVRGMFSALDGSYIGMHLSPTHARRVFPCIDDLTEQSNIRFRFINMPFAYVVTNSVREDGEDGVNYQFRTLEGPPVRWGMIAHNLSPVAIALGQVRLFARAGVRNQDSFATTAVTVYFQFLEEWTERQYFGMVLDQNTELSIVALPDTSVDWIAMSSVCIWEPDILMQNFPSMRQRKNALIKIGEGLARQWFGNVIYPETWNSNWILQGLATYAAYEAAKSFQDVPNDISVLDVETLFVTEVIQESLLLDSYIITTPLEPDDTLLEEDAIRDYMNSAMKYKSPALMRMFRLVLGDADNDFIQMAAAALLRTRAQLPVNKLHFFTELEGAWVASDRRLIDDIEEYIDTWVTNTGYPIINVMPRPGGVIITEEFFSFDLQSNINQPSFNIPLTYTTSNELNFNDDQIYNIQMMEGNINIDVNIDVNADDDEDGDFILFNIRGQGYYRVNYHETLWPPIIAGLQNPDVRNNIHPLNRATLIDDSLNLARGEKIGYDIALELLMTMELETDYAPWKAFVRNMDFIMRRLEVMIANDDDLDQSIYQRLIRRCIVAFENEIGFTPDPDVQENAMVSLTRGLVMEHACKAGYEPCVAAAIDWFTTDDPLVVNPNIPPEIRPAVYCTMVREGDVTVIEALNARLEIEESAYERVVIIQSFACSRDSGLITQLLIKTVSDDEEWGMQEKVKFFEALIESGFENVRLAVNFLATRTNEIRENYGGQENLEYLIYHLARHIADFDSANAFRYFTTTVDSAIDDSADAGMRAYQIVEQNMEWDDKFLDFVYEWIDENDASSLVVSLSLLCACFIVALFNH